MFIGQDKSGYQVNSFQFLDENICFEYSLEAPHRGSSNEYLMFSSRNKKTIDTVWLKKAPYQELCLFSRAGVGKISMGITVAGVKCCVAVVKSIPMLHHNAFVLYFL